MGEYVLIGSIVGLAGLAGLVTMGTELNKLFQGIVPGKALAAPVTGSPAQAAPKPQAPVAESPSPNLPTQPSQSAIPVTGIGFTTAGGTYISLPTYPTSTSQAIAVAGANGTTTIMANTLEALAKQLLDAGEISQTQYNGLIDLANQGHGIANLEKVLEDGAAKAASSKEYKAMKLEYNGKLSSPSVLADALGYDTGGYEPGTVSDPFDTRSAYGPLKNFLKTYDNLNSNGALTDPAVQEVVSSLVGQIAFLSEVSTCMAWQAASGEFTPAQFTSQTISEMTHVKSLGICEAGNGKDNGIQCSG